MIGAAAHGQDGPPDLGLDPRRAGVVVEAYPVVGRTGEPVGGHPAVAVLAGGAQEQRAVVAEALDGGARAADFAQLTPGDVDIRRARAGQLVELDHAGERARAIGAGARATHDGGAFQRFRRQGGPDHPAAEGIVLGHAIEGDQRTARAGRGDGTQGDALGGGVLGRARGAAEQRDAGDLLERQIKPRLGLQLLRRQADDGEGRIAGRRRQARGGDDDGLDRGRRRRGVDRCDGQFGSLP